MTPSKTWFLGPPESPQQMAPQYFGHICNACSHNKQTDYATTVAVDLVLCCASVTGYVVTVSETKTGTYVYQEQPLLKAKFYWS